MKKIAVVILNWNGVKLLEQFLPSVIAYSDQASIYVADNASTDASIEVIQNQFPSVKIIQNTGNFAEAKIVMSKNDAGGISGGISNGEVIMMRVAVKPPSSISKEQKTVDKEGNPVDLSVQGRHDPCIIPRFIPVAESMVALVLADHLLRARVYAK